MDAQSPAWSPQRVWATLLLALGAVVATSWAWRDIAHIARVDEESSQVLLALPVCLWLIWSYRKAIRGVPAEASFMGPVLIGLGWGLSWYGYNHGAQSPWHLGAVMVLVGAVWSVLGDRVMLRAWPVLVALLFLIPVPGRVRLEIAVPLQELTARGAEVVLVMFGMSVERTGMLLVYNDKPVRIDEACNGMRMVFALLLVCYGYAMANPLNPYMRVIIILLSPLFAVLCNIIRVVPTTIVYGKYGDAAGDTFHDISGWAMIGIAFFLLMGLVRLLEWAEVPVVVPEHQRTVAYPG
ncbi:MAG: exosortase/archaeosortase family protein [Planctomycetota bacterium]